MAIITYLEPLRRAAEQAQAGSSRHAVLCRLESLTESLAALTIDGALRPELREKAEAFLRVLEAAWATHEGRLFQTTFALNVVGEALVRTDLVHASVVEFLQVGLYFFGLETIERRWSARAVVYGAIHADHLQEFLSRKVLRAWIAEAKERMESGRIFCLTYRYLNDLRRVCWQAARRSSDVLDVATAASGRIEADQVLPAQSSAAPPVDAEPPHDRVALMLHIFGRSLSPTQRWIYLAKNRASVLRSKDAEVLSPGEAEQDLSALLMGALGDPRPDDDLGWTEIAERLGINEKSAKREYLRSLEVMLRESAREVFGENIPSNYVRRVLGLIRNVVQEKDLRIKSATGRGMGTLVEKWEVALRFVLNHEKVSA